MAQVKYAIVEHDGGWAYQVDGTYSETFATPRGRAFRRLPGRARAAGAGRDRDDQLGGRARPLARRDRPRPDRPEVEVED